MIQGPGQIHRKELNERSPLRLLERSIHGGLGEGNIGVMVGRAGVGKTAFLVDVALDDLMRGRKVLHVALDQQVDKIREYYDEIFKDLATTADLADIAREHLEMERHRNIHTYLGKSFTVAKLRDAVAFLIEHVQFHPRALIIEGYDFDSATLADLSDLRRLVRDIEAELWMSAIIHRDSPRDARGIPQPIARLADEISVILSMAHDGNRVRLSLLKDHDERELSDVSIALDPTTMLLVGE